MKRELLKEKKREYDRKRYLANKEKFLKRKRHKGNPEKIRARARRYRAAHLEECRNRANLWHKTNPEKVRALLAAWKLKNPERNKSIRCKAARNYRNKNLEKIRTANQLWRKSNSHLIAAHSRARRARKFHAMPIWACKLSIEAVYAEAKRLTVETGILHHVDHKIPLKHPLVCGLHVEYNLEAIPATENMRKHNNFHI